ncbi:MAG TPA: fluoride efflux transporter CrcB [Alphaproteobacteria bacterium]|nr:fluoride efflux transporter CrcB [Alphaproteobacteria bacterium]
MHAYLWIALGSGLGGVARFWLSGVVARRFGETFPLGTLVVNVTGCFVIGLAAAFGGPQAGALGGPAVRQFIMTGFCGGYTTFSSFSLQTLSLARDGAWGYAVANVLLSLLPCLAAVYAGLVLGAALTPG